MKCSVCNKDIRQGTGLMLVKNDGKILGYCNTKCLRNVKIRNPRDIKWITKKKTVKAKALKKETKKEEKKE